MRYCNTLIAVKNMPASLEFYKKLFGLEVAVDLGWCKTLTCGLTLQEHFDQIAGFLPETMKFRSNTMELYFETEDFEGFLALLDAHPLVERLHEPKTYPWLQRGIHIFDPDGHLIEVSESMYTVACREFEKGAGAEETAKRVQHPLPVVLAWYEKYQASQSSRLSVCGTDCEACQCYGTMCGGCSQCEGKVFHVHEGGACAIYACVTAEKGLKSCGECRNAPCEIWMNTRDPRYSDEEFAENVKARIQALKDRT
ncbi:MAG: hypothetical protein HFG70_07250 [Hungatella sp.]|nr:hypothetical protein [Hungatella sp.]